MWSPLTLSLEKHRFLQPSWVVTLQKTENDFWRRFPQDDLGNAAAWICSDEAAMVTGSTIEVDGGRTI